MIRVWLCFLGILDSKQVGRGANFVAQYNAAKHLLVDTTIKQVSTQKNYLVSYEKVKYLCCAPLPLRKLVCYIPRRAHHAAYFINFTEGILMCSLSHRRQRRQSLAAVPEYASFRSTSWRCQRRFPATDVGIEKICLWAHHR